MRLRRPLVLSVLFPVTVAALAVIFRLEDSEQIVRARFLMLACENCYHMEVEKSSDGRRVGVTIIPTSNDLDVEVLVSERLLRHESVFCLRGRAKLVNFDLLGIDPPGVAFRIEEVLPMVNCAGLEGGR